ncbi:MAG: glutathione S-transferase family protein [Pseudomonadota bacterium]
MITVYGRATSSNVQLVMWASAELGLKVTRLDYGHVHGGLDTPEFLAMNPHGKVPVLQDGDLVIWESAAILRYLCAAYGPGTPFWPSDPATRARSDMWAEWGKTTLSASFTVPIFWSRVRTAATARDKAALTRAVAVFNTHMAQLGRQVEGRTFVCGDDLTTADIVIGHLLFRWFTMDVARDPQPAVEAYYARLTQRAAYLDHVMVPYDSLRAEGA